MKKSFYLFMLISFIFLGAMQAIALNSYDKYGSKQEVTKKQIPDTINMINTVQKQEALEKQIQDTTNTISTAQKQEVSEKHHQAMMNMINTEQRLEATKKQAAEQL